ncbi:MAG: NAD(P)H-dependent oxidoreductase [Rhizobiales bacterium]|nr:NAD(P)H-dependent oxidoreductase [Hyphomicrobiales bacterium]NRB14595.1 NAD(P)H-dependent oxidoreductase [Hyphomicrobiales bacterium]
MTKIFIIDCHPNGQSFSLGLFEQYIKGAQKAGHEVKSMRLSAMDFEIDLAKQDETDKMEPCLVEFQHKLTWCEHVVFISPLWWGFMPAKMKGLIDRVFLPQYAYAYDGKSASPIKLLNGRSGDILVTSDTPNWYFNWIYRSAAFKIMRMQIFEFVGIKPVKFHMFSPLRQSTERLRLKLLNRAWKLGNRVS